MLNHDPALADWLAARTRRDETTGCLVWCKALYDGYPYGRLLGGPTQKIPRAIYVRLHGPLGPGKAVRQTCRNRACCEEAHFAVVMRGDAVLAGGGVGAVNARKTACKRGHAFDATNTYSDPSGRRRCRACTSNAERAWHATVGRKSTRDRWGLRHRRARLMSAFAELPMTRFVVALEIAGTAHVRLAARDADTASRIAYDVVRRPDLEDWWPRRQAEDFIAPYAAQALGPARTFEVSVPCLGTAYVRVTADGPEAAIAQAYAKVQLEDLEDWRPIRGPRALCKPSVALEADLPEDQHPED